MNEEGNKIEQSITHAYNPNKSGYTWQHILHMTQHNWKMWDNFINQHLIPMKEFHSSKQSTKLNNGSTQQTSDTNNGMHTSKHRKTLS